MKFNNWYKIKSDKQVEAIKDLMDAKFLPDCIFNEDYSKFKKVESYHNFHFNKL